MAVAEANVKRVTLTSNKKRPRSYLAAKNKARRKKVSIPCEKAHTSNGVDRCEKK